MLPFSHFAKNVVGKVTIGRLMVVLLHSSDYVSLVFSLTSFSYDLFVPYDSIYGY